MHKLIIRILILRQHSSFVVQKLFLEWSDDLVDSLVGLEPGVPDFISISSKTYIVYNTFIGFEFRQYKRSTYTGTFSMGHKGASRRSPNDSLWKCWIEESVD